jgi:DNA topoisomerase-1
MKLIIVESPTKANTIQKFLSGDYIVESSYGHVRDLPKSKLGIDIEKNFEPQYIIPTKARSKVSKLKKETKDVDNIILATDEDREGEAIAWHIANLLNLKKDQYKRIVFHEITKPAIEHALKNPREIYTDLVNAQQSRRVLDRLVGYKLSPFLWKKVKRGLSAGRVQSVAVRLICDKEKEIEAFNPKEYWTILARLETTDKKNFDALLYKKDGKIIPRLGIEKEREAQEIIKQLESEKYQIKDIKRQEKIQNPLPPFTTSLLQQDAWNKLRFSAKMTMRTAQKLYEQGLITYHRTDSFNLSEQSISNARTFIEKEYGGQYCAKNIRRFKTKKSNAQEAHEAIRPTIPGKKVESISGLSSQEKRLYELIWKRFIACQMSSAIVDSTSVEIKAGEKYIFKAQGQIIKFEGFLRVYPLLIKENILPDLKVDENLELNEIIPSQHFTKPPARYSEATLVKALENFGIGRPSTYAPIISTIQERNYVEKDENKKLKPTEIGVIVNNMLIKHFSEIVDIDFTARMEKQLDDIADGKMEWQEPLKQFYFPFEQKLEQKEKVVKKENLTKETNEKCPECGSSILLKWGRFGKFYACSKFPECKYTKPYFEGLNMKCPKCGEGDVRELRTKKGRKFYGCSKYPKCDYASWQKPKK